jgi:NAD-dependent SIR2 family protein deacetylase
VVQLHGTNAAVVCLDCRDRTHREEMQSRLSAANQAWLSAAPWERLQADEAEFAPDGDAEIAREVVGGFEVPECARCGGVLKPDVVFFGESVPQVVRVAMDGVDEADALLVAGSSLTVWSGFRFVKRAADRGLPIAIVNIGPTRGDDLATIKVEERVGKALGEAVEELAALLLKEENRTLTAER